MPVPRQQARTVCHIGAPWLAKLRKLRASRSLRETYALLGGSPYAIDGALVDDLMTPEAVARLRARIDAATGGGA